MRLQMSRKQPQKLAVIRQYMVAVSVSLPFAAAGSAVSWPSPTLPRILTGEAPVLLMDSSAISWMISLLYLGSLVSALPAGYLADTIGRQKTLLYFGLLPIISWILIILSTDPIGINIARFLAGVQIGVVSTIHPIYISEISQLDIRETLFSLNSITMNAGSFFVFAVGPFVSYQTLAWLSLILPFMFLFTFSLAPESPYFLIMKGDVDGARESLLWLRGDLNRIELEFELDQIEKVVETQMQSKGKFVDMFVSEDIRKATVVSLTFSVMKQLSGISVVLAYAAITLPKKSFEILTPNDCLIVIGGVAVVSSLIAACFPDIFGSKRVMIGSYFICSFAMTVVSVWFFLKCKTQTYLFPSVSFIPFLGFLAHSVSSNLACCPMEGTMKIGMFPTHFQIKASALATVAAALVSFLLNKCYLLIGDFEGMYVNYALYAGSCFLSVLLTVCYVPETSGKTMQEVQDLLNGLQQKKNNSRDISRIF